MTEKACGLYTPHHHHYDHLGSDGIRVQWQGMAAMASVAVAATAFVANIDFQTTSILGIDFQTTLILQKSAVPSKLFGRGTIRIREL